MNWVQDWRARKARRKLVVLGVMSGITEPKLSFDHMMLENGAVMFPWTFVPHQLSAAKEAIEEAAKAENLVVMIHRPSKFFDLSDRSEQYQFDAFLDLVQSAADATGTNLRVLCIGEATSPRYSWVPEHIARRLPGREMTKQQFDHLVAGLGLPRAYDDRKCSPLALFGTWSGQLSALMTRVYQLFL